MTAPQLTLASYCATGVGIALMLLHLLFPYLFPARAVWSEEDARQYAAAAADVHRLAHQLGGHDHDDDRAQTSTEPGALAAARQKWQTQQARLTTVLTGRRSLQVTLKWAGVLLAILGIGAAAWLRWADSD